MTTPDFTGKTILITGASRGIGRAAALAFAKAGGEIIAIAKTKGALEELDDEIKEITGRSTALIAADLTNKEISQLGAVLSGRFPVIDVVIANAGVLGELAALTDIDERSWDMTIATNLTANWNLIRQMDPLLRKAKDPRIVFVSTGTTETFKPYWGGYTVSKAGLEALAKTYANEGEPFGIRASILNPGPVRTRMRAKAMPGEDPMTLPHPDEIAPLILELSSPQYSGLGQRINYRDWKEGQDKVEGF